MSVKVRASFLALLLLMVAMQMTIPFFLLTAAVTLHELAHVLTAKLFGLKTSAITITPMGQAAQINGICYLPPIKQAAVILAGPTANVLTAALFTLFHLLLQKPVGENSGAAYFINVNLITAIWNLLPAIPLDGGRLLHVIAGCKTGFVKSLKICGNISRNIAYMLIFLGFVQTAIYPYDITLVAAALYLLKLTRKETSMGMLTHYSGMFTAAFRKKYENLPPARSVVIERGATVKKALEQISYNNVCFFHVYINHRYITIPETDLLSYAAVNGINGTMQNAAALIHINNKGGIDNQNKTERDIDYVP